LFQNVEGAALAAPFAFGGERRGLRRFVGPAWIRAESRVELVRAQAGVPVLQRYCGWPVMARKTLSSTGMEWVKTVAELAPERATRLELPLSAGPAGLASFAAGALGCIEMRVVFGVQLLAPRHVSRTKTWR